MDYFMMNIVPAIAGTASVLLFILFLFLIVEYIVKGRNKAADKLPPIKTPKVTAIRFYVYEDLGTDIPKCHTFKLGLGPCGKVVTSLMVNDAYEGQYLRIIQVTEDGERKVFTYRFSQIAGRIDITYDH